MIGITHRIQGAVPVVKGGVHVRRPALKDYTPTNYCVVPSAGTRTGDAYHPDVIDTVTGWRGFRYWMAFTPYSTADGADENPHIVASHNGDVWEVPPGGGNPVVPQPATGYNSDPDIVLDRRNDKLYLYHLGPYAYVPCRVSGDGVQWSGAKRGEKPPGGIVSPAVVLVDGATYMFHVESSLVQRAVYTGPTLAQSPTTLAASASFPSGFVPWHIDVTHAYGRFYGVVYVTGAGQANGVVGIVSDDGLNWGESTDFLLRPGGIWSQMYRATLQPAGDGFDVWVGAALANGTGNRIGRTHIPLAEFT